MDCKHDWQLEKEEINCSTLETRGSGQYNDPCYGAACPCDQGSMSRTYVCSQCGAERTEEDSGNGEN